MTVAEKAALESVLKFVKWIGHNEWRVWNDGLHAVIPDGYEARFQMFGAQLTELELLLESEKSVVVESEKGQKPASFTVNDSALQAGAAGE